MIYWIRLGYRFSFIKSLRTKLMSSPPSSLPKNKDYVAISINDSPTSYPPGFPSQPVEFCGLPPTSSRCILALLVSLDVCKAFMAISKCVFDSPVGSC
jgi:hypothetical protein